MHGDLRHKLLPLAPHQAVVIQTLLHNIEVNMRKPITAKQLVWVLSCCCVHAKTAMAQFVSNNCNISESISNWSNKCYL